MLDPSFFLLIVGLYFSASWCGPCQRFTPKLVTAYEELVQRGEVVFISSDSDEGEFDEYSSKMPWLAVPFSDSDTRSSLKQTFEVSGIPDLVILDGSGKLLTSDATMMIGKYGAESYPFSTERMQEVKAEEEDARDNQSLKSLLVHSTRDFLVYNDGRKVLATMREKSLSKTFKFIYFPALVAIWPNGRTLTEDAGKLVANHGAAAYPFTEERLKELEQLMEDMAKQWPEELQHALHDEHSLKISRLPYYRCYACHCEGHSWSYLCANCYLYLHPMCALNAPEDNGVQEDQNAVGYEKQDEPSNEGWVCDGVTCRKA